MKVSAYIPCFNNGETLSAVIDSVRAQTVPVDELYVADDGSTDDSIDVARMKNVEILASSKNLGRGATRARAMHRARGELVLSVDATNVLPKSFLEQALHFFDSPQVAAVFGRIVEGRNGTAVERWRGRHLFKNDVQFQGSRKAVLITYGTLVRKSAVEAVGGYNQELRHTEDADLGERLVSSGFDVIFEPTLEIRSVARNTLAQVLERYWRWYVGKEGRTTFRGYLSQVAYSLRVMALDDLRRGDFGAAMISVLSPHYAVVRLLSKK